MAQPSVRTGPPASRGLLTRGQPVARSAIGTMIDGPAPHAVLLVGPNSVGKTTLALDLAAGLLCTAADPASRPCRVCRACRLVTAGNHPDLHWLSPEGPGGQIVIGAPDDMRAPRGVRDLLRELALLPVEGGARVALIEGAAQMNEDAQNALLKTLEEPPPGVTIVLCADREEALLPTVRSRCSRVRLGPVGPREIELLLDSLGLADPPTAARLARIAEGRPGVAVAYARTPEAIQIRDEIARSLLDLLDTGSARRLGAARDLLARSRDLAEQLADRSGAGRPAKDEPVVDAGRANDAGGAPVSGSPPDGEREEEAAGPARLPAAERRRAARQLLTVWRDLARDLAVTALTGTGDPVTRRAIHDVDLLDELDAVAGRMPAGSMSGFLARLDEIGEQLAGNASPELAVDVTLLAWPRARPAAA